MPPPDATTDGHRYLYHWQPFTPDKAHWLEKTLATNTLYCPSPAKFNDPWDCKPHFNTRILLEPKENDLHFEWSRDICRRRNPDMTEDDIQQMRRVFQTDYPQAAALIDKMSEGIRGDIARRYRVYCFGPDVQNPLMWSHYADSHRGIALEFAVAVDPIATAMRCDYRDEFPVMKIYSLKEEDNLLILLAKSSVWTYEHEYRLVAQERKEAIPADTLVTDDSTLQLPPGAITAVVVGCEADLRKISDVVRASSARITVKRAVRVLDRYELEVRG
jgi:hypothetical protein